MTTNRTYNVFVVEDSDVYRSLLAQALDSDGDEEQRSGYRLHAFPSGEACLQNVHLSPDVLVLDYHLDGNGYAHNMNGLKLLKQMKEIFPEMDVVIISCQKDREVIKNMMYAGAGKYIEKEGPGSVRKVKYAVENFINKKEEKRKRKIITLCTMAVLVLVTMGVVIWFGKTLNV